MFCVCIWYILNMDNINEVIAKNLMTLRKQHKMTQLELAQKLNFSDKSISKWEKGESLPSIEILVQLAQIYGVTLDYFTHTYLTLMFGQSLFGLSLFHLYFLSFLMLYGENANTCFIYCHFCFGP